MRYTILGYNQDKVLSLQREQDGKTRKLDITDLLILKTIAEYMHRPNIIKFIIDDETFVNVKYDTIIEDLPVIDIKKQALADRLDKMVFLGLLEKKVVKNQSGTFVVFRMGIEYEDLLYSRTSSEVRVRTSSQLQVQENINNINNINQKNITEYISFSDRKPFTKEEKEIYKEKEESLFPFKVEEKETKQRNTLFVNSDVYAAIMEDQSVLSTLFGGPEYEGLDLMYYVQVVADWSDQKNMKRTKRGWVATIRNFIRSDRERNKLRKKQIINATEVAAFIEL